MSFSHRARRAAHVIWEASFAHPFVQGIGRGNLPEDRFVFFLKQDYVFLIEYCRFLGIVLAKAPGLEEMRKFSEILQAIVTTEMDLHRRVCADFGFSPKELEKTKAAPFNLGYTKYLLATAHQGETGECVAALLPCFWGYNEIGLRLKRRGLPKEKHCRDWVKTYSSPEFTELTSWCKGWVDRYAKKQSKEKNERMEEIFLTTSRWEYLFWEMAYHRLNWPV